jgi:hypothetical protein
MGVCMFTTWKRVCMKEAQDTDFFFSKANVRVGLVHSWFSLFSMAVDDPEEHRVLR